MTNNFRICKKLKVLLTYYKELQELAQSLNIETYLNHLPTKRAIERQIQLIVECGTGINNMLLKSIGQAPASDYYNSFIGLAENHILDMDFALKIAPSTGLRNILVHEYSKIDDTIVYNYVDNIFKYYREYMGAIAEYLDCNNGFQESR